MRWPDGLDLGIGLGQAQCIKRYTPTARSGGRSVELKEEFVTDFS